MAALTGANITALPTITSVVTNGVSGVDTGASMTA